MIMHRRFLSSIFTSAVTLAASAAIAGPTPAPNQIFTAENLTPSFSGGYVVYGEQISGKLTSFRNQLVAGVSPFDFESIPVSSTGPYEVAFASSSATPIIATLNGGTVRNETVLGRYNTTAPTSAASSPRQYLEVQTAVGTTSTSAASQFSISFSRAISAFAFFGTDIGDFQGSLFIDAYLGDVLQTELTVRSGAVPPANGNELLFYGFAAREVAYDRLVFRTSSPAGNDVFGFDDFWAADANQIIGTGLPPGIPEPGSLALAGLALFAAAAASRARQVRIEA